MKKVLFIAPSSFPVFGAEAIVNIKLLQAMARNGGFQIDLVSRSSTWDCYPSEELETYGVKLNSINIIPAEQKLSVKTLWQHIKCFFIFKCVYKGAHWAVNALPIVERLIKANKYDYVLTKNGSSFLLGYYLKVNYGIKWVATWNDPYPVVKYPFPYGKGKDARESLSDKWKIRIMRKFPDITIFPSKRLLHHMQSYLHLPEDSVCVVPHVVNNGIFNKSYSHSDKLRIIHSGNMKYPRDPELLLRGFGEFLKNIPNAKVEMTILGQKDNSVIKLIEDLNICDYIIFMDPVSYLDSLDILSQYDIALILEAQCEEGIFLPTKVSDFIQCKKQIFAISPKDGVLHDLYATGYVKYFADNTSVESIFASFVKVYNDFLNDDIKELEKVPIDYSENSIISQYLSF